MVEKDWCHYSDMPSPNAYIKLKVIFLDIDGVLNVIPKGHDKWGAIFHPHLVENLKRIIDETGAKIVISSTWRMGNGLPGMIDMWKERGLPGEVIGITPNFMVHFKTTLCRGKEIDAYLDEHPEIENYVIIDDDSDMEPHQLNNFVMTSGNTNHSDCVDIGYGLTKECSDWAIKILMG
jgi:hypothetical protein